jgi:hypothetical protein
MPDPDRPKRPVWRMPDPDRPVWRMPDPDRIGIGPEAAIGIGPGRRPR